jgi:hypothetical protein
MELGLNDFDAKKSITQAVEGGALEMDFPASKSLRPTSCKQQIH